MTGHAYTEFELRRNDCVALAVGKYSSLGPETTLRSTTLRKGDAPQGGAVQVDPRMTAS